MCFCLYLATSFEPPLIPDQGYQQGSGKINTSRWRLEQSEKGNAVRNKFTLPCVTDMGSDVGCGCGFRHGAAASFGPDDDVSKTQPNHLGLVSFLAEHCGKEPFVELVRRRKSALPWICANGTVTDMTEPVTSMFQ